MRPRNIRTELSFVINNKTIIFFDIHLMIYTVILVCCYEKQMMNNLLR